MSSVAAVDRSSKRSRIGGWIARLQSIEVGPKRPHKIPMGDLAEVLKLLLMLLENGLSLPKALASLAQDRSTRKHAVVIDRLRHVLSQGGTLADGMALFPRTFTPMMVQQVRIGSRSGSLNKALLRICEGVIAKVELRKRIIKKVSYPALVTVAGAGLMIFMCVVVVPEFETVYGSSGVELPMVTRVVTGTSRLVLGYGWMAVPIIAAMVFGWIGCRRQPTLRRRTDAMMLRMPLIGPWLRDVAVLQFADSLLSMIQCGYTPVEAVEVAVDCVRNAEIRAAAAEIRSNVRRGQKLSAEIEKHADIFSLSLCQLIRVGEQSGDFPKAMRGACAHLKERLETRIDATVGLLEPVLTISLAAAIGGIVLSIYTPMFHMFEVLE